MICYFFYWFQVLNKANPNKAIVRSTMFCKVCFDASKSDYKTHNVKDSASNVVCPLLLNTKCHKCGYFGHTTKYCKLAVTSASASASATKAYVRRVVPAPVPAPVPVPVKKSAFACLENVDEDICQEVIPSGVEEIDLDKEEIIWGVGFKSMIGKRWVDVVGC